jgi:hypothetical protein
MAPSGNRFYHDHSPEFTSLPRILIGGEHYISKLGQGMHQVSEISIFPQFYAHYVRSGRTICERGATPSSIKTCTTSLASKRVLETRDIAAIA